MLSASSLQFLLPAPLLPAPLQGSWWTPHNSKKPLLLPLISKPAHSHAFFHSDLYTRNKFGPLISSALKNSSGIGVALDLQHQQKAEERNETIEKNLLAAGLQREFMPRHVALILDGNRRWAKKHNLPPSAVHDELSNVKIFCRQCIELGIPVISDFLFSTTNWTRPQVQVDHMMNSFENYMKAELENFINDGIKVSFVGNNKRLPTSLQEVIREVEKATKNNTKLHLIYGLGYGGQYDIMQACKRIGQKVRDGVVDPEQIDESLVEQHLLTSCTEFRNPELVIRTGGKQRLSDYYLWNFPYSELLFSELLAPDFGETQFIEALRTFHDRRRYYDEPVQ